MSFFESYLPAGLSTLSVVLALLAATLLFAFVCSRLPLRLGRLIAWGGGALFVFGAHQMSASEVPGFRMLVLISVAFLVMKGIVSLEAKHAYGTTLSPLRFAYFAIGWVGMEPRIFAAKRERDAAGGIALPVKCSSPLYAQKAFGSFGPNVGTWRSTK